MSDVSITTRIDGAAETKRAIDSIVTGLNALTSDGDKASKSVGSLSLKFTELNNALELAKKAWQAVSGVAATFINAAAEDQAEMARLAGAVNAAGINFENVSGIIDTFNNDLALLAGVSDEQVSASFQRMIGVTKNVESAMNATTLAADISKARNIELADATRIVEQAMIGNLRGLKQLGIQLDENATATEALDALQKKFGDGLESAADTYATAAGRFEESVGRVQESIGNLLLPVLTKALDSLGGFFRMLSQANIDRVKALAAAIAYLAGTAGVMMLVANFGTLWPMIIRVSAAFGTMALSVGAVVLQFGAVAAAGLAVGFVLMELAKNIGTIGDIFSGLGGEIAVTAKAMWQAAKGDFKEAWQTITVESTRAQEKTNAAFSKLADNTINDLNAMKTGVQEIWADIAKIFESSPVAGMAGGAIKGLANGAKGAASGVPITIGKGMMPEGMAVSDALDTGIGGMATATDTVNENTDAITANLTAMTEWAANLGDIGRTFESLREEMSITADAVQVFFEAFMDTSSLLGSVITETFTTAWDQFTKGMGDAVAQMLVFGKDFGESLKQLGKQIAATIISTLVQITMQRLIQWAVLKMLNIAQSTQEIGLGLAKVYLNSFASAAAIPMVGWAMAPGVAQGNMMMAATGVGAAYATGSAMGAAASAGSMAGGNDFIPDTGSYTLHRGERVVNAQANADLMNYLKMQRDARSLGGGGARNVVVQMQFGGPVIFDDIAEAEFIDRIQRGLNRANALEA